MTATTYFQDRIKIKKLNILPGLRVSYFSPTQKVYFEPRLSGSYDIYERIKLKSAYGHYYQFVKRVIREDILQGSRDFWVLADDEKLPVAKAIHYILGFSIENEHWLLDLEAYRKDLTGLSEYSLRIRPAPRILLMHVQPEYAALYETNGNSSLNLAPPPTNIENGLGIFTGYAADTLKLLVKKP